MKYRTAPEVRAARKMYPEATLKELADKVGVSVSTVQNALRPDGWRRRRIHHIPKNELQKTKEELVRAQGTAMCAICRERPGTDIDHDHDTGRLRGVLCNRCNRGLGFFDDHPDLLRYAAEYLEGAARRA